MVASCISGNSFGVYLQINDPMSMRLAENNAKKKDEKDS
jgi:hypothetical protein